MRGRIPWPQTERGTITVLSASIDSTKTANRACGIVARRTSGGALALPRAALFFCVARHQGPLQADGAGRDVGHHPAGRDHAPVHRLLRASRRALEAGQWIVFVVRLRRALAVDVLRERGVA